MKKRKYDLSKIMSRAWGLRKTKRLNKSEALKQAWAEAKAAAQKGGC